MVEVILHVYDVTSSMNVRANSMIMNINKIMRDGIGIGGIFHSGVQVFDEEWSFGFCENGSGVFSCPPKTNPMYTYRETLSLGHADVSVMQVNRILRELSHEWPGCSYDLLSHNCNHFCEEFCAKLGVQKLPLWVNRFANVGDAAVEAAGNTMERLRQAKAEVLTRSRSAVRYMFGPVASAAAVSPDRLQDSPTGSSGRRFNFTISPSRLLSKDPSTSQQNGTKPGSNSVICLPWKD
ncbi:unnamed protein product [Sphagnum jensenii]|uniref:PPPDE domain-containing protein n=1 Tax=Sphagnum jensenii TaxID=128206 RepID=A0ABP0W1D4_9BRYO